MKTIKGSGKHKRNYLEIELKDSPKDNEIKLAYGQIRIREILAANDGINGVHFKLSDSTSYGDFVKTIDILQYEGAKRYMAYENDIWFLHEPADPSIIEIPMFAYGQCIYFKQAVPSKWRILKKNLDSFWHSSWQLIIAFTMFLLFNIYSIKRSATHQ